MQIELLSFVMRILASIKTIILADSIYILKT